MAPHQVSLLPPALPPQYLNDADASDALVRAVHKAVASDRREWLAILFYDRYGQLIATPPCPRIVYMGQLCPMPNDYPYDSLWDHACEIGAEAIAAVRHHHHPWKLGPARRFFAWLREAEAQGLDVLLSAVIDRTGAIYRLYHQAPKPFAESGGSSIRRRKASCAWRSVTQVSASLAMSLNCLMGIS